MRYTQSRSPTHCHFCGRRRVSWCSLTWTVQRAHLLVSAFERVRKVVGFGVDDFNLNLRRHLRASRPFALKRRGGEHVVWRAERFQRRFTPFPGLWGVEIDRVHPPSQLRWSICSERKSGKSLLPFPTTRQAAPVSFQHRSFLTVGRAHGHFPSFAMPSCNSLRSSPAPLPFPPQQRFISCFLSLTRSVRSVHKPSPVLWPSTPTSYTASPPPATKVSLDIRSPKPSSLTLGL